MFKPGACTAASRNPDGAKEPGQNTARMDRPSSRHGVEAALRVTGVRNGRERAVQTLSFEAGGLMIVTPPYAWLTNSDGNESLVLLVTISLMMMAWSALFNTVFDHIEHRATHRVASDRPQGLRVLHTVLMEATAVLLTWPVIAALTGYNWDVALGVDLTLTLAYMVYGYFFHRAYDRVRPVRVRRAERHP
jgi:uncharacterized membrane protein